MPALWTTCRFTHSRPIPPPKRWRYIRARSSVQAKRMRQYVPIWYAFLVEHPRCAVFPNLPSVEAHHSRGRRGALLFAVEFFIPVSRAGHQWIGNHPDEAKARGFILPGGGAWNCFPPMHNYTPTKSHEQSTPLPAHSPRRRRQGYLPRLWCADPTETTNLVFAGVLPTPLPRRCDHAGEEEG